jgi:putative DNA primase/helicase
MRKNYFHNIRRKQNRWLENYLTEEEEERARANPPYEPFSDYPNGNAAADWAEACAATDEIHAKRGGNGSELHSDEWLDPTPLPEGLSPVASLDTSLLPKSIAPWVCDISDRMQCPPDYLGTTALTGLGSVLGRKIGICPQAKTDWIEVANQWGLLVGPPGSLKSPAILEALKPIFRMDDRASKANELARLDYETKLAAWKANKQGTPPPTEPVERRYFTNDTTYEKLGETLIQNKNGTLVYRDEMVSLLKTLDREEFAATRGFYLTGWNGNAPYTFDRIGRGTKRVPAVCISLLGSATPGRIAEYVRRVVDGGHGDDGLIQRFGQLVWPDQPPGWEDVDEYPNSEHRQKAYKTFDTFDTLLPGDVGAITDDFHPAPFLRFDQSAHDDFVEWRKDLERKLRSDEFPPSLLSHLAKYRKLVPTLALITHLADEGSGLVTQRALQKAIGLAAYLETHAIRAYAAGPESERRSAKAILLHMRRGDLKDGFMAREVHQHHWSNLTDTTQVKAGLDLLCDFNWLKAVDQKGGMGRPTTAYQINPKAKRT